MFVKLYFQHWTKNSSLAISIWTNTVIQPACLKLSYLTLKLFESTRPVEAGKVRLWQLSFRTSLSLAAYGLGTRKTTTAVNAVPFACQLLDSHFKWPGRGFKWAFNCHGMFLANSTKWASERLWSLLWFRLSQNNIAPSTRSTLFSTKFGNPKYMRGLTFSGAPQFNAQWSFISLYPKKTK